MLVERNVNVLTQAALDVAEESALAEDRNPCSRFEYTNLLQTLSD